MTHWKRRICHLLIILILYSTVIYQKKYEKNLFFWSTWLYFVNITSVNVGTGTSVTFPNSETRNCWHFTSGIVVLSCLKQDFSCSTVCGCRCLILLFMLHHTFLTENKSGLQAGQSIFCLQSHSVVVHTKWNLALSCCNNKRSSGGGNLFVFYFLSFQFDKLSKKHSGFVFCFGMCWPYFKTF